MAEKLQTAEAHHKELVDALYGQMKPILEKSEQPVYIYLDDNHKACNPKFATMLGYKSPEEWAAIEGFLDIFVAENSRETLSTAYWNLVNKMIASTIHLTFINKERGPYRNNYDIGTYFFHGASFRSSIRDKRSFIILLQVSEIYA